jgi:hypothetical protein
MATYSCNITVSILYVEIRLEKIEGIWFGKKEVKPYIFSDDKCHALVYKIPKNSVGNIRTNK